MLLTADIGNTSITLGLFDGDALIERFRLTSDKDLPQEEYEILLKQLFKNYKIDGCIIASVVNELTAKFQSSVDNVFNIVSINVTSNLETGIKLQFKNKKELGADRIANAIAAYMLYQKPIIVIDMGTATTFDILDKKGNFIGGIIATGINLQLTALNKFTSKLPKISPQESEKAIGIDTESAILSGVIRGSACMIDGLINQCESELKEKVTIVATGGYAALVGKYVSRKFNFINPDLTLEGLRLLYALNNGIK